LVVIFAVALVVGVGGEGGGASEAGSAVNTGSSELRTAALTVVLGFVVFVLGQIVQRFFLEPMQEQKRIIGEIAFAVLYYGNVSIMANKERQEEAVFHLRKLAGQLRATLWTVPWYRLFESLRMVEKRENVLTASEQLVG
jgi:hypothetical protein